MSRNNSVTQEAPVEKIIFTPAFKCECCGRLLVLLRKPEWTPTNRKWAACSLRTWDGNPWYVPFAHKRHYLKRYSWFKWKQREARRGDPFFSLD